MQYSVQSTISKQVINKLLSVELLHLKTHCTTPCFSLQCLLDLDYYKSLNHRIMVASRDLAPGDIILKEKPALIGPNMDQSQPLCLACYALLSPKKFHPCRKCKAPLCSAQCESHPDHLQECSEFKQCPMGFYRYVSD